MAKSVIVNIYVNILSIQINGELREMYTCFLKNGLTNIQIIHNVIADYEL